jgi:hypothetical protein
MTHTSALGLAAAAGVLLLLATPATAAEPTKEISTAATHAGLAAGSTDLKMVQTHLQHVINCLEGPQGKNYDAKQLNPCKDQGTGAIPDAPADKKAELQKAVAMAQANQSITDLTQAKKQAGDLQTMLSGVAK